MNLQRKRCSSSHCSIAIFYTILFTLLGPRQTFGIRWLALSKFSSVATVDQPPSKMCDSMKGSLIKKQITFCKRNPMFMDSVQRGAAQAIDECQFQFRSRRWNCSTLVQNKIDSDYQQLRSQLEDYGRGSSSMGMEGDKRFSHMLPPSKIPGAGMNGMNGRQQFSGNQLQGLSNLPYQTSQQQHRSLLDGTKNDRTMGSSSSSSNMMGFGSMNTGQQFLNDEPQRSSRDNSRNRVQKSYRSNSQKQVQQQQYSRRSNSYDSRSSKAFQSQQGRYNSNYANVRNNRGINSNGGQYNKNVRRGRRLSRKARHGQNGTSKQSNDEVTNDTSMINDKASYETNDNGDILKNNAVPLPNVGSSILQSVASGSVGSSDGIQVQPSPWLPRQQSTVSQGNSTAPAGGSLLAGIPLSDLKKDQTRNWSDNDRVENRSKNKRQRKNNRENGKKRKGGRGRRKDFGRQDIFGKADRQRNGRKGKRENNKKKSIKADWAQALGSYPVVSSGTREMAFVHAISSAGVAHALTRACSSGELENCGCDRSLRGMSPEGFQWSGCSDNVDFGITFSRTFVDARDRRKSRKRPKKAQPLMNLHNNEAGRKLLERNMKVECKCHGVSGSCELKTCWRSVAPFRMIGQILKDKFDSAHEVHQKKKRGRRMLLPRFERFKPHTDTDLVYLKSSPDYCEFDVKRGSLGTHGRECDHRSPGIDGCELMCCNRGYTTRKEKRVERCKCKFHWCCFVECEECVREVEVSVCN